MPRILILLLPPHHRLEVHTRLPNLKIRIRLLLADAPVEREGLEISMAHEMLP